MCIQKCEKCFAKFKWSQIEISLLKSYSPIVCHYCGSKYIIKRTSRVLVLLSLAFPFPLTLFIHQYFDLGLISIGIYLLLSGFIFCVAPFFVRYNSDPYSAGVR
ncbi:TIGR04104 family putative zinc finger protein [Petroclostridium xylanilyticum]|jgi:CXXC-20-CXXC protein|uniref:TIGR04104 family putative zinc finger protein n=1 Tax=Petroclostridium xylanilyticum TaxID=1792311 RepID=UPI000B9957FE|nr:TIGR04104 family putative zinc finger protein [Petroclostridium xylanilyticum]